MKLENLNLSSLSLFKKIHQTNNFNSGILSQFEPNIGRIENYLSNEYCYIKDILIQSY